MGWAVSPSRATRPRQKDGSGAARISPAWMSARGLEILRRFYFDLALSSSPTALPALLAFADPSRITYGSDFPNAPAPAYQSMTRMLDAYPLTDDQRHAIDSGNAQHLFPRLAGPGIG